MCVFLYFNVFYIRDTNKREKEGKKSLIMLVIHTEEKNGKSFPSDAVTARMKCLLWADAAAPCNILFIVACNL